MGLSLTNLFQRPYVTPDRQTPVRKREDDEKSSATKTQKEQEPGQNTRSKGLQYVEQKTPSYTPAYETKYSVPLNNLYSSVNIHKTPKQETPTQTAIQPSVAQAANQNPNLNNKINIAQILKDFRNTAIAIGTPDDLNEVVEDYLSAVEKQVQGDKANKKLVKSTLSNAALVLDNYISETLNKDSKVVENWVDALFLQEIDFKYNEESINERFLVKFPENSKAQTKRQEELQATSQEEIVEDNPKVIPITVAGQTNKTTIPQDKQLKSLFIQAKKYAYANDPENAIRSFEQALNRALEIDDTETSGKIYYEVGKIYDDHDYVAQALKSYNQSIKLSTDENVKAKAHYSMAQIYDDVNQITPAMQHYFSTVSYAGEAENIPAQSASLTKIGNIYTDMYDKEAFSYYDMAGELAKETDNKNLNGFVDSNTAKAYMKFDEPEKALKSYSKAVQNYSQTDSSQKTAQNYLAAADIMVEFNNLNKAHNLLTKAQKYARQTDNVNLMNEINTKLGQLEALI